MPGLKESPLSDSSSSNYSSLHLCEALMVDACDGFAEAIELIACWAPPTWKVALIDRRYSVALLDFRDPALYRLVTFE
jgi:hypothetical protein